MQSDNLPRFLSASDKKTFYGNIQSDTIDKIAPLHVHYIHIPKTGGESVMMDSVDRLLSGQTLNGNMERPYLGTKANGDLEGADQLALVFLRDPSSHVLSQFMECKYDRWGRKVTKNKGFPGYGKLKNVLEGFDEWVAHFANHPDDYSLAFGCYDPWNMQARYMTRNSKSHAHYSMDTEGRWPSLEEAKSNLRDDKLLLGVVEHYSASMCLLENRATLGDLTKACKTCDASTHKLVMVEAKQHHMSHHTPHHSVDMITNQTTLEHLRTLTTIDQQLYDYALTLFKEEIQSTRDAAGIDLLCGEVVQVNNQTKVGHDTASHTKTTPDVQSRANASEAQAEAAAGSEENQDPQHVETSMNHAANKDTQSKTTAKEANLEAGEEMHPDMSIKDFGEQQSEALDQETHPDMSIKDVSEQQESEALLTEDTQQTNLTAALPPVNPAPTETYVVTSAVSNGGQHGLEQFAFEAGGFGVIVGLLLLLAQRWHRFCFRSTQQHQYAVVEQSETSSQAEDDENPSRDDVDM